MEAGPHVGGAEAVAAERVPAPAVKHAHQPHALPARARVQPGIPGYSDGVCWMTLYLSQCLWGTLWPTSLGTLLATW